MLERWEYVDSFNLPNINELDSYQVDKPIAEAPYTERWSNYLPRSKITDSIFRRRYAGRGNSAGCSIWGSDQYQQFSYELPNILQGVNSFEPSPFNNAIELKNAKPSSPNTHDEVYIQIPRYYTKACEIFADVKLDPSVISGANTDIDCYVGFEINSAGADKSLYTLRFYHDGVSLKAQLRVINMDDEEVLINGFYSADPAQVLDVTSLFDFTKWNRVHLILGRHVLRIKVKPFGGSYTGKSLKFNGYRTSVVPFVANETKNNSIYSMQVGTLMTSAYNGYIIIEELRNQTVTAGGNISIYCGNGYRNCIGWIKNISGVAIPCTFKVAQGYGVNNSHGYDNYVLSSISIADNATRMLDLSHAQRELMEYVRFIFANDDIVNRTIDFIALEVD